MSMRGEIFRGVAAVAGAVSLGLSADIVVRIVDLVSIEPNICKIEQPVSGCITKEVKKEKTEEMGTRFWLLIPTLTILTLAEGAAQRED